MQIFWHCLLIGCIYTATVCCSTENPIQPRVNSDSREHEDDVVGAEDHEHHRIIIVVPKETPHHVNHVHTYKLSGKIPLVHSGKVEHDHKHSGKVAHEHGHAGKSTHSHKHTGAYGHQHKHLGYLGHKHFGHSGGGGGKGHLFQSPYQPSAYQAQPDGFGSLQQQLHNQQQLHHQLNGAAEYVVQQHGGDGRSGIAGYVPHGGGRPVSGQVHFVPSSQPKGLGSFMPSEIQQYVDGRHGAFAAQRPAQYHRPEQYLHQYGGGDSSGLVDDNGQYNVIQLRVPDQNGPNVIKHLDIDLANNVAKLKTTGDKHYQQQPFNFKSVTQYNKVIGLGRAVPPTAEEEFDSHADEEDVGGGGGGGGGSGSSVGGSGGGGGSELSLEDIGGYRFGEGYRLAAVDHAVDARDFSANQERDEETDEFNEPVSVADDDYDSASAVNAYSQAFNMQY